MFRHMDMVYYGLTSEHYENYGELWSNVWETIGSKYKGACLPDYDVYLSYIILRTIVDCS